MAASALVQDANDGVLPTDVLRDVLLRVPAKALCRLRLVCRSWRALTSDPGFARAHSSRHPLFLGLYPRRKEIHVVDVRSCSVVKRIRLGGPDYIGCRSLSTQAGLVCCVVLNHAATPTGAEQRLLVLDPATGAAFDTSTPCPTATAATGDYKVLRFIFSRALNFKAACAVTTLGLGGGGGRTWRARPSPVDIVWRCEYIAAVRGFAYVRSYAESRLPGEVAVLDLATEEWRPATLRGPPVSKGKHDVYYDCYRFCGLDGCFAMLHHRARDCSMDIWILADMDSGLWTKRCSMRCAGPHGVYDTPRPLVVLDDGRIVARFQRKYVLRSYDPRKDAWEDMAEFVYNAVEMHQGSLLCSYEHLQG